MIEKLRREALPSAMSVGRAVLGPVLILGERCNWSGLTLASLVVTALLSDIFDGVLARRWHCDTAAVRLLDTLADTVFYLCAGVALWVGQPQLWRENAVLLPLVLLAEAANQGFSIAKFGKPASYHSDLAKTWGLVLATAVVAVFADGHSHLLMQPALVLGIVCNIEGLAMSAILPAWHKDVKTLLAAWRLRLEWIGRDKSISQGLKPVASDVRLMPSLKSRPIQCCIAAKYRIGALLACLMFAPSVLALEPGQAVYVGGSAAVTPETAGTLDTSSPTALLFRYKKPDGSPGQISIEYAKVKSASSSREVLHQLGVAPTIAAGLIAAREHRYFLTITWTDPAGFAQVVQMEVRRQEQQPLLAVLHARMPPPACPACARPPFKAGTSR